MFPVATGFNRMKIITRKKKEKLEQLPKWPLCDAFVVV